MAFSAEEPNGEQKASEDWVKDSIDNKRYLPKGRTMIASTVCVSEASLLTETFNAEEICVLKTKRFANNNQRKRAALLKYRNLTPEKWFARAVKQIALRSDMDCMDCTAVRSGSGTSALAALPAQWRPHCRHYCRCHIWPYISFNCDLMCVLVVR